ncbi:MAG TPA: orotidine-5'-phosphate decarboxylase [Pseudomonadales bacterium]|nr:orotidine-5'-phosphate decarboxylase [Pseudomonadales bacterium]
MSSPSGPRTILALDYHDPQAALRLVEMLDPQLCRLKVGKELFTRSGPEFVCKLIEQGYEVFLDLKFHDIPQTVARAVQAAAELGVWMVNVHASGGRHMMESAANALARYPRAPLLIAVTVLTSLDRYDLNEIGVAHTPADWAVTLAKLAEDSGLQGVVCSAQDLAMLKPEVDAAFLRVTPGIRLPGDEQHDQKRVLDPAAAIRAGSHYLVVGRSVTAAADPVAKLHVINAQISAA